MRILHKTQIRKWWEMCRDGIKTEEYLEIKPYWMKRLLIDVEVRNPAATYDQVIDWIKSGSDDVAYGFQDFDIVSSTNGYGKDRPNIKWQHLGITIGTGKIEWGAEPGKRYFVLKIGEIIK